MKSQTGNFSTADWEYAIVCYDDFTASSANLPNASHNGYFYTIKPWGNSQTLYEDAYFDIAGIVFFENALSARAYKF